MNSRTGVTNRGLNSRGIQVGVVKDNKDPERMHRVLVTFPVEKTDGAVESYWCRMMTPMAGKNMGLVMLPDIGTEVVVGFAMRTLEPYILGGVYNGKADKPEPYKNDDENDNIRILWSRNSHMVRFDDTPGAEKVGIGAQAGARLEPKSGVIFHELDSSQKTITEFSSGSTDYVAKSKFSIKCKNFNLNAANSVNIASGQTMEIKSGAATNVQAGGVVTFNGVPRVFINTGTSASPMEAMPFKMPGGMAGGLSGAAGGIAGGLSGAAGGLAGAAGNLAGSVVGDAVGNIAGDAVGNVAEQATKKAVSDAVNDISKDGKK